MPKLSYQDLSEQQTQRRRRRGTTAVALTIMALVVTGAPAVLPAQAQAVKQSVRTFNRVAATTSTGHHAAAGSATMRCGWAHPTEAHKGSGYRHIKADHENDWEALGAEAGENWRDVADIAMSSAFVTPSE